MVGEGGESGRSNTVQIDAFWIRILNKHVQRRAGPVLFCE